MQEMLIEETSVLLPLVPPGQDRCQCGLALDYRAVS